MNRKQMYPEAIISDPMARRRYSYVIKVVMCCAEEFCKHSVYTWSPELISLVLGRGVILQHCTEASCARYS